MALFEACEVIRLAEFDAGIRKGAEHVRNKLLEETKSENNLLPHEQPKPFKKKKDQVKTHPLLPRFDVF